MGRGNLEFILLGAAVCALPVGIREQGEESRCLQKVQCGWERGGHVCVCVRVCVCVCVW